MTFRCDRCGAQYASNQALRDGNVYQAKCPACGHFIRLRSPSGEGQPPRERKPAAPSPLPGPEPLAAPPPDPAVGLGSAAPPPARADAGYLDLVLDDTEPRSPPAAAAATIATPPQRPVPATAVPGASLVAMEGGRRKVGMGLLVGGIALAVLFAAVGALALRRPAREEAPVSRALLPRAEWATSEQKRAGPSEELLDELDAEERQAAAEGRAAPVRQRSRPSAGSPGHRQPRQAETAAARAVPVPPVPVPEPPAAPPAVMQPVAPPPQPAEVAPAPPPARSEPEAPAAARSATALAGAGAGTETGVDFTEEMTPPAFVSGPDPEYTARAIERAVEGLMVVRCAVTVQGTVHGCQVLRSLPFMDQAVIYALERRRYKPATLRGRPIEVNYTFRIRLTLPP